MEAGRRPRPAQSVPGPGEMSSVGATHRSGTPLAGLRSFVPPGAGEGCCGDGNEGARDCGGAASGAILSSPPGGMSGGLKYALKEAEVAGGPWDDPLADADLVVLEPPMDGCGFPG